MKKKNRPVLGITMGDPSGIGPEIILKAFEKPYAKDQRIIIIGDFRIMQAAFDLLMITTFKLNRIYDVHDCQFDPGTLNILDLQSIDMNRFSPGKVQSMSGNAAFEALKKAVELANNKDIDAVVTAPLNKEALHSAGHKYPGHTEILALLTGTKDYAMLLHDKKLSVIHVSTHISLLEAITGLRQERIEKVIQLADDIMGKLCNQKPKIAVAGINPHAGENGLFGNEEIRTITPAVKNMRDKGINVEGPFPPDTVFLNAMKKQYDVVVAMYHDQGHIPLKLLGFSSGVNVTVGLPFIRTSVDHGTAFELAWKGVANENSMVEAIKLAVKLTK